MAVASPDPKPNSQKPVPDITRNVTEYATPVVDTRKTNYNTLATFAQGSKWAADFYLQILAKDTAPSAFDPDRPVVYGQCRLIKGFELLVTSQIDPRQQDEPGRSFVATGTANVYSVITPNEGDVFVADVGDGRNGVFTVTKSTRNATYTEAMTTIEFRQIAILTNKMETELNKFVVEKLFFDREMLRNGVFPLIKEKDVDHLRRLNKAYRRLTNLYVHEFFDTRFRTLMVPNRAVPTYDPHMARFAYRVLDKNVCQKLGEVQLLTTDHNPVARVMTVLNAIEQVDADLLYSVAKKAVITGIRDYSARVHFMNISTSGIANVVAVVGGGYMIDLEGVQTFPVASLVHDEVKIKDIDVILPNLDVDAPPSVGFNSFIHPVITDDYYIFSEAFYNDSEGQSKLENIVLARLNREVVDVETLADIADQADKMNNLDRFYYIPIILAMIKMVPGVL